MSPVDEGTVNYFDEQTPDYPSSRTEFVAEFLTDKMSQHVRLLSVGVGTGADLRPLISKLDKRSVTGLDVSLQSLRLLGESTNTNKIKLVCGTANAIPFQTNSYDAVIAVSLLHHLVAKSPTRSHQTAVDALKQMVDVLRPGGFLFLYEPAIGPQWFSDLVFYLKRVGSQLNNGGRLDVPGIGNFGAPVTAFLSETKLEAVLRRDLGSCELLSYTSEARNRRYALGFIKGTAVKAILKKGLGH